MFSFAAVLNGLGRTAGPLFRRLYLGALIALLGGVIIVSFLIAPWLAIAEAAVIVVITGIMAVSGGMDMLLP